MCETKPGDCTKKNIVYEIECRDCKKGGKEAKYFRETARRGWERMREHYSLLENHPERSALGDHMTEDHEGGECEFTMKLVSKHLKPLERQCKEGLMISEYKNGKVINSRGEWGKNLHPDFGILEDSIYKVKRKKSELTHRCPSKPTKRRKVEVCETACEAAYESSCESNTARSKALPMGEITDVGSTQCTENSSVMISTCGYDI